MALTKKALVKLAIYYRANKKNENSDDRDGDYPIRSHPTGITLVGHSSKGSEGMKESASFDDKVVIPTGHPLQCLYARVHISLALL